MADIVLLFLYRARNWFVHRGNFLWGNGKVRYTNQIRTRYRNWRTTSATQLQPSKSLCYIGYTSTWWQHDCWLTVQTLYAIHILTAERISQGHVQNGRQDTFSWPTLYFKVVCDILILRIIRPCIHIHQSSRKLTAILVGCYDTGIFSTDFHIASNIKLHENPYSGSRVVTCARKDTTKLTVVFRNFTDVPKTLRMANKIYLLFFFVINFRTNDLHFSKPVFPKNFSLVPPLASKNTHGSSHPCSPKYWGSRW